MGPLLSSAITFITLALVFYSVGVWTERYYGILKRRHHALFWLGFIFDTAGTTLMSIISHGLSLNLHAVTGGCCHCCDVFPCSLGNSGST
jgi:uncharacterized repeat protein (TIGR03987 family)